jgi:glutamyl/glutaminyl-tRNA synthetase
MGITDVIRGGDHISNTPKQISLFHAFGSPAPRYAHHSLLIGPDRKPLSKRHGATRVIDFRSMGIMRDALINYLGTMGRNTVREIMNMDELVRTFSLDSVSASDNVFDREKLLWFNREYLKHMPIGKLIEEAGLGPGEAPRVSAVRENASTINELRDYLGIFAKPELDERALHYLAKTRGASEIARSVRDILSGNEMVSFDEVTKSIGQPGTIRKKDIFMILRAFITGRPDGPPLKEVFPLVPSEIIIGRIEAFLNIRHER